MQPPSMARAVSIQRNNEARQLARRLLLELLVFVLLSLVIIVCEFGIEPYARGFFCDDETIRYPFRANTVTPFMLGLLDALPPLIILFTEYARCSVRGQLSETLTVFGLQTPVWMVACFEQCCYYGFGLLLTLDATEIAKYTVGRLRPHFMAVCQPQFLDGGTCADSQHQQRYVEEYVCMAHSYTVDDVRQARLSFPSGHSSLAFFAMVYAALYIQRKFTWRKSKLWRHLLQFALIMLAWFTALSRITDHWHHWSDVLVGTLIGVVCAVITARFLAKFSKRSSYIGGLRIGIPRQDTTTTLQDVIATPPPYTLDTANNSFSTEQYCTKV